MMMRTPASTRHLAALGACLLSMLALSLPTAAVADAARRDGGQDELRKAQYLLRQVAAQRDAAQASSAKLQAELDKVKADRDHLKKSEKSLQARLSRTEASLGQYRKHGEVLTSRLEESYDRIKEIVEKYKALASTLHETQVERAKLQTSLTAKNHEFQVCAANNVKLYHASLEMLDLYQKKGVADALQQDEPFIQLKRVQLENLVQDYKFKVEDLRVENKADAQVSGTN